MILGSFYYCPLIPPPRPPPLSCYSTARSDVNPPLPRLTVPVQKKHRYRPGTRAIMDIRKYQKSSDLLLRKLPFSRLVKELAEMYNSAGLRWTAEAMMAMQEAAEDYLTKLFEDA